MCNDRPPEKWVDPEADSAVDNAVMHCCIAAASYADPPQQCTRDAVQAGGGCSVPANNNSFLAGR